MTEVASRIDYVALFDAAPVAMMAIDREYRYVAANAEYLRVTASRREDLLGRLLFDLFPHDPGDLDNAPAQLLRRSFQRVFETGRPDHVAFIPYAVPAEVDGVVTSTLRYWSATHAPVFDGDGRVAYILQHTADVTALARRDDGPSADDGEGARISAAVMLRADAVQRDNLRLDAERERLGVLFEQAPSFMCFLEGRDHVFTLANASYQRLVGGRAVLGKPLREALPEVVAQGFTALLDRVLASGEPYLGEAVSVVLQRRAGEAPEESFLDFIYQPVFDARGVARGVFVQGHDVTARKRAERESEAARRVAEAFAEELMVQSREVKRALEQATARIAHLEAELASRG